MGAGQGSCDCPVFGRSLFGGRSVSAADPSTCAAPGPENQRGSNSGAWCVWGKGEGEKAGLRPRELWRSGSSRQVWRGKGHLLGMQGTVQGWDGRRCWLESQWRGRAALEPQQAVDEKSNNHTIFKP